MLTREAQEKMILDAIRGLRMQVDTRLLFIALLAHAGVIAEGLIAAGISNADYMTKMFAEACADAIKPRDGSEPKPTVVYADGDDEGKMH